MNDHSSLKIDQMIWDCCSKTADIILQGRRSVVSPALGVHAYDFADNADYCSKELKAWKKNINSPVVIDLYLSDSGHESRHMLERWIFQYQRKDDLKESARSAALVNRKIVTLLRTLYCFVRLLPGFQLLLLTQKPPTIYFQFYNPEYQEMPVFKDEFSLYEFPRVNTSKGILSLSVRYLKAHILQGLLGLPISILSWKSPPKQTASALTPAIPIPPGGMPVHRPQEPASSGSHSLKSGVENPYGTSVGSAPYSGQATGEGPLRRRSGSYDSPTFNSNQIQYQQPHHHQGQQSSIVHAGMAAQQRHSPSLKMLQQQQQQQYPQQSIQQSPDGNLASNSPQWNKFPLPPAGPSSRPGSFKIASSIGSGKLGISGRPQYGPGSGSSPSSQSPSSMTPVFSLLDNISMSPGTNLAYNHLISGSLGSVYNNSGLVCYHNPGLSGFGYTIDDNGNIGMSPPFPHPSSNLLSTSPQVPNAIGMQIMATHLRRNLSDNSLSQALNANQKSATQPSLDTDLVLSVLPQSPFEANYPAELAANAAFGKDDCSDDSSSDGDNDEDMPFAWGQSEASFCLNPATATSGGLGMGIADQSKSLADQYANPPALLSFPEYKYSPSQLTGIPGLTYAHLLAGEIRELKNFRANFSEFHN